MQSNNARFWAFEPHVSRVVNTDRGSQSFFGFYGINAVSHLVDLADGKMESIQQALLAVKAQQTDCTALVVFCRAASAGQCSQPQMSGNLGLGASHLLCATARL
ncbi:hypothetical protein ACS5NO_28220 [Larkinella sp. GY13]|uniref:hypothetical protein n=1 Tax=Larkinella sp. GY13 TaxID=3453720 RepID=UPI003EEF500B